MVVIKTDTAVGRVWHWFQWQCKRFIIIDTLCAVDIPQTSGDRHKKKSRYVWHNLKKKKKRFQLVSYRVHGELSGAHELWQLYAEFWVTIHFSGKIIQTFITLSMVEIVSSKCVLVYFLVGIFKFSSKSNLSEEGFVLAHSSRVYFIMVGKSRHQELEADGHIMRKYREGNACCCSISPLTQPRIPTREW